MKQVELRAWVPRGLDEPLGPLSTSVEVAQGQPAFECEVSCRGAKRGTLAGARVTVGIWCAADSDDELWAAALEAAPAALHRALTLAAFVGKNRKPIRTLRLADFCEVEVIALEAGTERKLEGEIPAERIATIHRRSLTDPTQRLLDGLKARAESEALWLDALESALESRRRDAVVAARAAVEVAWKQAAQEVLEAHLVGATERAREMMAAIVEQACSDMTPLPHRLDRHSASIFGESFQKRWPPNLWNDVQVYLFKARNAGAHGSGAVSDDDAHRTVETARRVLDDLEVVRSANVAHERPPVFAV